MLHSQVPQFTKFVSNLEIKSFERTFHFDPSKTSVGLTIADDGKTVEHTSPTGNNHKVCVLSEGFNSGSMYCQFRILNDGPAHHIMIGVTDESQPNMLRTSFFPGYGVDKGVSYYGYNGNRYFSNAANAAFGPSYTIGDTIGILMNCDFGTVSFFKNGDMIGTALGSGVFRMGATYYPAVTLCEIGAKVEICAFEASENLTCSELFRNVVPRITQLCPNLRVMSGEAGGDFIFDPCKATAGLQIDNNGLTVEQTNSVDSFKVCLLSQGFNSGIVYFEFKVLFAGPVRSIKIGVVEGSQFNMLTSSFYPGLGGDQGVSYCSSGARCCSNIFSASCFPAYATDDTVGILMNFDCGTSTFFKNGEPVGTALDVFRAGATYYPAVSLNGLGQKVAISTF